MAKNRENKKLARYEQEEINQYVPTTNKFNPLELIKLKKLDFKLTSKQQDLIKTIKKNRIMTIVGPPGTSKTFVACYAAVELFLTGQFKQIILSKPTEVVSGTKDLGALPGDLNEKIKEYAESFFDAFDDILDRKDFTMLYENKVIEFKPAQFVRGRTFKNSIVIIDEAQNFDIKALKTLVTRLGRGSIMLFLGDSKQNDINKKYVALDTLRYILNNINDCENFEFDRNDIVRDKILIDIIDMFETLEANDKLPDTYKNT